MKKKSRNLLIVSSILLVIFILGYFLFTGGISLPFAITLPIGARSVGEQLTIKSQNFACDEEYCEVKGQLNCDTSTTTQLVIFRKINGYDQIVADTTGNAGLEGWNKVSSGSRTPLALLSYTTPEGYKIGLDTSGGNRQLYIWYSGSAYYRYNPYSGLNTDPISSQGCIGNEKCAPFTRYACNWKFKPSPDPNFAFANKLEQSSYVWYKSSDPYLLRQGETLLFQPVDGNNNNLPQDKFSIVVQKYKVVCANECSTNDIYCSPKLNQCPSGSVLNTREVRCPPNYSYSDRRSVGTICVPSNELTTLYPSSCQTLINDNSYYKKCDGKDSNSCNIFQTEAKAPSGQVCKPLSGNIGQPGIGSLVCDNDPLCIYPSKTAVAGTNNQYTECEMITSGGKTCPIPSSTKSCPSGLIFNDNTDSCECPPAQCEGYEKECSSTSAIHSCTDLVVQGLTCKVWSPPTESLEGQRCVTDIDGNNARIECLNLQCDNINDKQCTSGTNNYYGCVKDATSGCFSFSTTTQNCGALSACVDSGNNDYCQDCNDNDPTTTDSVINGQCVNKRIDNSCLQDVECNDGDPTTDDKCVNNLCKNTVPTDSCTNSDLSKCKPDQICASNRCRFPTTGEFCAPSENGKTKCINNQIKICKLRSDTSYRWELIESCDVGWRQCID